MCQWIMILKLESSVNKPCLKRPLADNSRWRHIRRATKPRFLGNHASQIKSYYGTLSGSHGRSFRIRQKNLLKRSLAKKSRWRHIRLAMKPRYLGYRASEMKSYYGTVSVSYGRSFRISHEKLPEAPLSGENTMTSYPIGNKISLSRKPCIPEKKVNMEHNQ